MRTAKQSRIFSTSGSVLALALALVIAPAAHAQAPADDATGDGANAEIVVTGLRQAQIRAIDEKRIADNVVETLAANDVGKLPDQNVAEAVKRLPGLSVANDQGEGRYVIIRGIDPNLINVTLNGQTLPAPEAGGRVVKLDDLPSGIIQAVTVTKSLLPDQDANAIGGAVDIRTKNAFDSKEAVFFDGEAVVGRYDLNGKSPYELNGTIGGRFGADQQFGAVVAVNYSRRPIESENYQGSETEDFATGGVPDGNGLRDYNLVRTRLGIVGNFDWHPSDDAKIYLRTSHTEYEDHETRDQNRLAVDDPTAASLTGSGTVLVRRREENDFTNSVTLGGDFNVGGGRLTMSGGWTKAVKKDPVRSEFTFKSGTVDIDYDPSTYPYTLVPAGGDANLFNDPSAFKFNKWKDAHRYTYEQVWQGRADYEHPIALGDDSSIKAGVKYLDRRKFNDEDQTDYKAGSTKWYMDTVSYSNGSSFYDGMFTFGDRINFFDARDYAEANPGVLKLDTAGTIADSLSGDFDVKEQIFAGYAMATLKFGDWTLVPGVRVEHTHDKTAAKVVDASSTLTDPFNSFGDVSYTDVFPGINVTFRARDNIVVRGAVTTSIGRPNYPDLAPYVIVEDDTVPTVTLGNPDLKPYKAVNFDASVEYYPNKDSVFTAGFFHKEIDNPIYVYQQRLTGATLGGVAYATADVVQPLNADSETITGVEFNAQTQFTALPGIWGGFGVSANYAHIWGHAKAPAIRSGDIPLGYQSNNVANIQIFFEKYGVVARLAFNYRSSYLDTLGGSATTDEYTDGNGQLDFHVSYQVMPQVTVFGDAINLTDAPWRRYIGSKPYLVEREHYGMQLRGGVQIHF